MVRKILKTEVGCDGLWLVLQEGNQIYREWVSSKRFLPNGTILIFADKTTIDGVDEWGLLDINLWIRGIGSVL